MSPFCGATDTPVMDSWKRLLKTHSHDMMWDCIFTGHKEVVVKVIFLHLFVILFTGGVSIRVTPPDQGDPPDQADPPRKGRHPPDQADPRWTRQTPRTRQTPPDQADPHPPRPGRHPPLNEADPPGPGRPPRPGRPTPPRTRQTPPQTRQTPPDQADPPPDPPREADSSIRSMSGRYASYWNAFLLKIFPV